MLNILKIVFIVALLNQINVEDICKNEDCECYKFYAICYFNNAELEFNNEIEILGGIDSIVFTTRILEIHYEANFDDFLIKKFN
jgi:hypothetical protein